MRKILVLLAFVTLSLTSFGIFPRIARAVDPAKRCFVQTPVGPGGLMDCADPTVVQGLTGTPGFLGPPPTGCWNVILSPGASSIKPADCNKEPFGNADAKVIVCKNGKTATGTPDQSDEDLCKSVGSVPQDTTLTCLDGTSATAPPNATDQQKIDACKDHCGYNVTNGASTDPKCKDILAGNGGTIHAGQATTCKLNKNFFVPTWYEYLPVANNCAIILDFKGNPGQIWLIGLAIADIALRLAGLITVFVIISGGYKYIISQFDPEGTKKAKDTILNGIIGLVIVILSTAIVNLVGALFK